ncbi:Uncharacterised protein [Mycobacteroides abscessus subsp. abscessus]|nr:Uncharacterised protein [Mycobacteroides abscessus subsp. abscessus]
MGSAAASSHSQRPTRRYGSVRQWHNTSPHRTGLHRKCSWLHPPMVHDGSDDGFTSPGRRCRRLRSHRHLLRLRSRHRPTRPPRRLFQHRFLPLGAFPTGLGYGSGLRIGQLGCGRDHGHVRQRGTVRHGWYALLLDWRSAGHAVPGYRHDAVLLWLTGAQRARIHVAPLRSRCTPGQRHKLRRRTGTHRRSQPVSAGNHRKCAAGLAALGIGHRRGGDRVVLHHSWWFIGGHLQ